MKKLSLEEMQNVQGGSYDCAVAIAGGIFAAVGIGFAIAFAPPLGFAAAAGIVTGGGAGFSAYGIIKSC